MGREISFWWDTDKRIRVAKAGAENSLFYEAYRQALAGVAEIVRASVMQEQGVDPFFSQSRRDGQEELRADCDRQYLYDYPNNIIVFSGERGAGKSSAMLTFVSSLKDKDGQLFQDKFLSSMVGCELPKVDPKVVGHMLRSCRFVDVPPIDPTTLENNGQILTVILARMFRLASSAWEDGAPHSGRGVSPERLDEKNKLIQKFSTCYEHIQAIKRGGEAKPEYEGLETLAELGDGSLLKVELYELVEQLLRFCLPKAGDSSYLVLQIDDTDMNIKQAYAILEDLRRYLVIPRLIIVMAADLKHLTQVVESSLLKDYDDSLDARHEYVEKITHQYITKLFPQTRQIDLPALGTYLKEHAENTTIRYQIPGESILPDHSKFSSLQDQIIRLIYRKTGMVFLEQEHHLHPIIPCNMRLLAHFLSMLVQMEDVDDPGKGEPGYFLRCPDADNTYKTHAKKLRTRLQNIQRFRNYFLSTWVNNSLSSSSVQLFKDLEQTDVADRIRYICVQLNKRWKEERKTSLPPKKDGEADPNSTTDKTQDMTGRGQYADMAWICQEITENSWNEELKRLVFALQTYCSLFAHTLALEELIDYYEKLARKPETADPKDDGEQGDEGSQYGPEGTGLGCSFVGLHLLFDSHLFPYFGGGSDRAVTIKLPNNGGNQALLRLAWKVENPLSISELGLEMKELQYAILLYSMLADYQGPKEDGSIWFDLMKPVTNCLYFGDRNGWTPFSKTIFGSNLLNVSTIGEELWHAMGNSALLTVLNCDIQVKMGAALRRMVSQEDNGKLPSDYNDWITRVNNMYIAMKGSLGSSFPIESVKKIDFFKWLEPLATKGVEISAHWAEIVKRLGCGITYTVPPQEPGTEDAQPMPLAEEAEESTEDPTAPKAGENQPKPANLEESVPGSGKSE